MTLLHLVYLVNPILHCLILNLLLDGLEVFHTAVKSEFLISNLAVQGLDLRFSVLLELVEVFLDLVDQSFVCHRQRDRLLTSVADRSLVVRSLGNRVES